MAGCALNFCVAAIQWKACSAVIEVNILPDSWLMATSAIRTELPPMWIFCSMTGITIRGHASIYTIGMAGRTRNSAMTAGQREAGLAVIKMDILPIARVMTIGTFTSHLPGVNIFMARCTI